MKSISFAHKDGVSSIKLRQFWHTCDAVRVVRRAVGSENMLALSAIIYKSTSEWSLLRGEDDGRIDIVDEAVELEDSDAFNVDDRERRVKTRTKAVSIYRTPIGPNDKADQILLVEPVQSYLDSLASSVWWPPPSCLAVL